MAVITKSIGATGRDYSTATLWEADLDNTTPYDAGDDAVGEMYDDSAFDESVTINGGGTLGLSSVKLSVAAAERHDGTAGTGARFVMTTPKVITINPPNTTAGSGILEWFEYDGNGVGHTNMILASPDSGEVAVIRHLIVHDSTGNSSSCNAIRTVTRDSQIIGNIVYDLSHTVNSRHQTGIDYIGNSADGACYGNTVYKIAGGTSTGNGKGIDIASDVAATKVRNNIAVEVTGGGSAVDFEFAGAVNITSSNNLSEDETADDGGGSNHLVSQTVADIFISTTDGSEDLHLKTGSPAINAGVDLTTSLESNIDIDGRDRDAEGDTWDIGADEFVDEGGEEPAVIYHRLGLLGVGA